MLHQPLGDDDRKALEELANFRDHEPPSRLELAVLIAMLVAGAVLVVLALRTDRAVPGILGGLFAGSSLGLLLLFPYTTSLRRCYRLLLRVLAGCPRSAPVASRELGEPRELGEH